MPESVPPPEPPGWYRAADVKQVPYDPRWPLLFEQEADVVRQAVGEGLVAIEHVGSTAVPGLSAKPIIDILAAVSGWERFGSMVQALERAGYLYTPHSEADDPDRKVFRKPSDMAHDRTHHLHVTEYRSNYWNRILAFRDHLRRWPADAEAYASLKARLAVEFAGDSRGYTRTKAGFVSEIERMASGSN